MGFFRGTVLGGLAAYVIQYEEYASTMEIAQEIVNRVGTGTMVGTTIGFMAGSAIKPVYNFVKTFDLSRREGR